MSKAREGFAVITVRLPASLHKAIKRAAHDRFLSLNAFCLEALEVELRSTVDPLGRGKTLAEVFAREETEGDDR